MYRPAGRLAEHTIDVTVAEKAVGIEAVPDGEETVPERVARAQRSRVLEVELAPVRTALVALHYRLRLPEIGLVLEAVEDVHGDVPGRAAVGGAERDVVGRDRAHLDGEADQHAGALDHRTDVAEGRQQVFTRE